MDLLELLDFFEPPVSIGFDVSPDAALDYLYSKGLRKSFSYADLSDAEHASGFTVAKMADMDMLGDMKSSLEAALEAGTPFKQWAQTIMPTLQAKGWWGKDEAGNQLGSAWRLETIFRTNMQSAYAVGEWQQVKAQEEVAPFLMYDAVDDFRTRPEHAAMDGKIHPVGSTFWKHYHPPNGYNCRCGVIQLSQDEIDELGLAVSPEEPTQFYNWTNPRTGKVEKVAVGTDPGFDFNPGQLRFEELQNIAQQKAAALDASMAKAAQEGILATNREVVQVTRSAVRTQQLAAPLKLANQSKAAERAAAAQIAKALAEKTPYLAKAIQTIQATAAGKDMSAGDMLKAAQEKSTKLEASSNLSEYKKALLAGKTPNAKAKGAFDALPEEAQASMTDGINAQLATIKAENAALDEIAALTSNPNSLPAKTLAKMPTAGVPAVKVLEDLKASVAAQKKKQVNAQGIAGLKKAVLAGKTPTPAQKEAFQALPEAEQTQLMVDLAKQKAKAFADAEAAKPAPPAQAAIPEQPNAAPTGLDPDDLVQTGPQGGSNPGGEYTDTSTGVKWYLKYPDNVEAMRNEMLANRLYQLTGVEVPEMRLIQFRGKPAIASRIVEGLRVDQAALTKGRTPGVQEHFAIDAWLSDWDVIGPDFANTKLNALGRGVRIDPGGSLRFRAMGGMKGEAFGNEVTELESMRNVGQNAHAGAVFRHTTQADMEDGVRRILAISDTELTRLVNEFGPINVTERQKLLKTLIARREYLAKKYPRARAELPEPLPDGRVTDSEQKAIEASRANGVTLPTDSDVIEDHHVVITTLTGPDGKPRTRMTLKLRPDAGKKLQGTMGVSKEAPVIAELAPLKAQASEFFRGVGALAKKGEALRDKDISRALALLVDSETALTKVFNSIRDMDGKYDGLKIARDIESLQRVVRGFTQTAKIGQPAKAFDLFNLDVFPDTIMGKVPEAQAGNLSWKALRRFEYQIAKITKGFIREGSKTDELPGVGDVREVDLNGARVRYIPYAKGNSVTSEGYLQIDLDGAGAEVTRKAFKVMDDLKIPTTRPSELDRLELYLERIASIRTLRNTPLVKRLQDARKITDQKTRTTTILEMLNADVGFDMRKSPNWNPQGITQAFGHGRTIMLRPDIDQKDVADFEKDVVVYHNPSGLGVGSGQVWSRVKTILEAGGQFSSQLDRVRRGVASGGSSVSSDHESGGANYIFTRLIKRKYLTDKVPGVYWRARQVTRLDAFSYDGDVYGTVKRSTQEERRAKDLVGMRKNAQGLGNETNFRDSISLFDDLEKLVFNSRAEFEEAMAWLRANGYETWPDGRRLEDVLSYRG